MRRLMFFAGVLVFVSIGLYFFQSNNNISAPKPVVTIVSPSPTGEPTQEQIVQALAAKNNWDASRVEVSITSVKDNYAKGSVAFKGEMGGGLWFAAKVGESWNIVYDGNGIITCDRLTDYPDFPKDIIPSCYDTTQEQLITR